MLHLIRNDKNSYQKVYIQYTSHSNFITLTNLELVNKYIYIDVKTQHIRSIHLT